MMTLPTTYSAELHCNDQDFGRIALGRYIWIATTATDTGPLAPAAKKGRGIGETWININGPHWLVIGGIGVSPGITDPSGQVAPVPHVDITRGVTVWAGTSIYIVLLGGLVWWIDVVPLDRPINRGLSVDHIKGMIDAAAATAVLPDPILRTAHAIEQWLAVRAIARMERDKREAWIEQERTRLRQRRTGPKRCACGQQTYSESDQCRDCAEQQCH